MQDSDEIIHIFRELVLGAYLIKNGFNARYEYKNENKTPDWTILTEKKDILSIVELGNFHIDKRTETEIEKKLKNKGEVACFWRDQNKDNLNRLEQFIVHKATIYKTLINNKQLPYVFSIFCDFRAAIDFEIDLVPCLVNANNGIFKFYPELSGVLFFENSNGSYNFLYKKNMHANNEFEIPSGIFF